MLLYRRDNFHVYGYTPRGHPKGRRQAVGMTVRVRARHKWRWFSASVYWPRRDLRLGRGTLALELCSWLTDDQERKRRGLKTFVRLKVGMGSSSVVRRNP